MLTIKQAKALSVGYEKDPTRWYVKNVDIKDGYAVWSNSLVLFKTKLKTESENGQVSLEDIKKNTAIAKIEKKDLVAAELIQDCQKYPPYDSAFPKNIEQKVVYNVNTLMMALKFFKEAGNEYVEFNWEDFNRPLLLNGLEAKERTLTGDQALVVPTRY